MSQNVSEPTEEFQKSLYQELRPLAEAALRKEAKGHSLEPTILINDAYLKLIKQENLKGASRVELLAAGANIMRRILIDACRRRNAEKRGGGMQRVPLDDQLPSRNRSTELLDLELALAELKKSYPRAASLVVLRFYGGMTLSEMAQHLKISESSVSADWRIAKAWLSRRLAQNEVS